MTIAPGDVVRVREQAASMAVVLSVCDDMLTVLPLVNAPRHRKRSDLALKQGQIDLTAGAVPMAEPVVRCCYAMTIRSAKVSRVGSVGAVSLMLIGAAYIGEIKTRSTEDRLAYMQVA